MTNLKTMKRQPKKSLILFVSALVFALLAYGCVVTPTPTTTVTVTPIPPSVTIGAQNTTSRGDIGEGGAHGLGKAEDIASAEKDHASATAPRQGANAPTFSPTPETPPTVSATATLKLPTETPTRAATDTQAAAVWGQRTKTSGCVASGGLPDSACTPGDIFPTATKDQICTPGYSSSVRSVPDSEKEQAYAEYGIASHTAGDYEVDHLVSLELGGSNDISNLFPEAAEPRPGFHEKDKVENYLHSQVCTGRMALADAQKLIATNWLAAYAEANSAQQPTAAPTKALPALVPTQPPAPAAAPTQPPAPTQAPVIEPTQPPAVLPTPASGGGAGCCKHCNPAKSKPCGNTCISLSKNCHTAPGCACTP